MPRAMPSSSLMCTYLQLHNRQSDQLNLSVHKRIAILKFGVERVEVIAANSGRGRGHRQTYRTIMYLL